MIHLGNLKFSLAEIQDTPEAAKHLDAFMGASHAYPNWQHIKTSNGYWAYTDNKDYTTYIAFSIPKHVYDNFTLLGKYDARYYPEHINTTYGRIFCWLHHLQSRKQAERPQLRYALLLSQQFVHFFVRSCD